MHGIIQLLGHCITRWYAISRYLVKLTELGTSSGPGDTVHDLKDIFMCFLHSISSMTCFRSISFLFHELQIMYIYAPNFEEVEEAYWFGPVRPYIHPSVCVLHLHPVKNSLTEIGS